MKKENNIVGERYLHIGNSGVTFKIRDDKGPKIEISSSSFGNNQITQVINTDKYSLKQLAELFLGAYFHEYETEDYCHKARVMTDDDTLILDKFFDKIDTFKIKRSQVDVKTIGDEYVFIVYLDVGNMGMVQSDAYAKSINEKLKEMFKDRTDVKTLVFPVRFK